MTSGRLLLYTTNHVSSGGMDYCEPSKQWTTANFTYIVSEIKHSPVYNSSSGMYASALNVAAYVTAPVAARSLAAAAVRSAVSLIPLLPSLISTTTVCVSRRRFFWMSRIT